MSDKFKFPFRVAMETVWDGDFASAYRDIVDADGVVIFSGYSEYANVTGDGDYNDVAQIEMAFRSLYGETP